MSEWNASDYAQNSAAQAIWARELMAQLKLMGHESVLDVGCGDGKITAEIAQIVRHSQVLGWLTDKTNRRDSRPCVF